MSSGNSGPKRSSRLAAKQTAVGRLTTHQVRDIPSDTNESVLRVNVSIHTDFKVN